MTLAPRPGPGLRPGPELSGHVRLSLFPGPTTAHAARRRGDRGCSDGPRGLEPCYEQSGMHSLLPPRCRPPPRNLWTSRRPVRPTSITAGPGARPQGVSPYTRWWLRRASASPCPRGLHAAPTPTPTRAPCQSAKRTSSERAATPCVPRLPPRLKRELPLQQTKRPRGGAASPRKRVPAARPGPAGPSLRGSATWLHGTRRRGLLISQRIR